MRFVNTEALDPKSDEGKSARRAVLNSEALLGVWKSNDGTSERTGDPVACALAKFCFKGRFSMEVSKVSREACALINRDNAPLLMAMSAKDPAGDRACMELLDGRMPAAAAVAMMRSVLRANVSPDKLDKLTHNTQELDKQLNSVETLELQIKTKKDLVQQARTPAKVAFLEAQVTDLEKDLQVALAKLEACKEKLTATDT